MLTLKMLRDDPEMVINKLKIKNFDAKPIVDRVLELDTLRRNLQTESDALLAQQKKKAAEIGALMKQGKKDEAESAKAEVAELKAKSGDLLAKGEEAEKELLDKLVLLPNLPCKLVAPGKGAEDNEVVKMGGPEVNLPENALPHPKRCATSPFKRCSAVWLGANSSLLWSFNIGCSIFFCGFRREFNEII